VLLSFISSVESGRYAIAAWAFAREWLPNLESVRRVAAVWIRPDADPRRQRGMSSS
jgi:hypothetical protein